MTQPKSLTQVQHAALSALAERECLTSAQSTNLVKGTCAWGTLNRLRDAGFAEIGYLPGRGQRVAWITDEGRRANSLSAVRGLLLAYEFEDPHTGDAELIAKIAEAVGLTVIYDDVGNSSERPLPARIASEDA